MYEQRPTQYLSWAEFNREDLVLGNIQGAFLVPPPLLASSPVPLSSPFMVVSLPLTGIPRGGTCPIRPYLQLLGIVVRTERYGCVRHKALSTLMVCYLFYPRLYPFEEDFSVAEEGFFHGLGPWPSIDIQTGLLVFFPPQQ